MNSFQVPVNPEYDFNELAESQADYVNPVELNYKLIEFQNEHARVATKTIANQRKRAECKVKLRDAEHQLARFRNKMLRLQAVPTSDRKTNILIEAYVERIAFEQGYAEKFDSLQFAVRQVENEIELLDAEIEAGKSVAFMLRDFYENIKTHLAFRKHEYRQIQGLPGA